MEGSRGARRGFLRVELARSVAEFEGLVGTTGDPRRVVLRTSLLIDFGFILAYWFTYLALGALLVTDGSTSGRWLGALALETATFAALFDVMENTYTLALMRELDASRDGSTFLRKMRRASLAKWGASFSTGALLAALFIDRGGWCYVIAVGLIAAAVVGLGKSPGMLSDLRASRPSTPWMSRSPARSHSLAFRCSSDCRLRSEPPDRFRRTDAGGLHRLLGWGLRSDLRSPDR